MTDQIVFDEIDKHGPQAYRGTYDLSPSEIDRGEISSVGKVTIDARADKGDLAKEYIVEGSARFTADLNCSRCLEPYPFAHASSFHVRFRPRPEPALEGEEIEIGDKEELDVEFYSDRTNPLRDLALEQVQLAIPMKPLCDESCLGLCAKCGANRAREECSCDESMVDQRWDALRGIREELNKKKQL